MTDDKKTAGVHEAYAGHTEVEDSSDRSFGIVFTVVFLIIGLWPLMGEVPGVRWWAIAVAAVLLAVALVRPVLLAPLNRLWARFGLLLHKVVNPLVMGLLFFVTVTPIGVVMRLFGKDFLHLKLDPAADTYWIERDPPGPPPDSLRNQF